MTAYSVIDAARLSAMAECIVEDNICTRIEAGSLCAGSDVAAWAMTGSLDIDTCACCGEMLLSHTADELVGCQEVR
jgi:hypothetical protein